MALVHSIGHEGVGDFAELLAGVLEKLKLHDGLLDRCASDTPAVRTAYRRAIVPKLAFFEANLEGTTG